MTNDDELTVISENALSRDDRGRAGVKTIDQITDYQVRNTGELTAHTIRFGADSYFSITYSADGRVVGHQANKVQFERRGGEVLSVVRLRI